MRSLVLLAAGSGSRLELGYNKMMYRFKDGKTLLETTLDIFYNCSLFDEFIIVYNKNDLKVIKNDLKEYKKVKFVEGVGLRHNSVYEGIKACKNDIVYVHDGARCNFNISYLRDIEEEIKNNYKCVTLGVMPKDTISQINDGIIEKNLNRNNLINIQTPQAFDKNIYLNIYSNTAYTDESSLFFKNDYEVKVVKGSYNNLKITTVEDLNYYEYLKYKK